MTAKPSWFLLLFLLLTLNARAQCPLLLDSLAWEEIIRDDFGKPALDTTLWSTVPPQPAHPLFGWGCEWYDGRDTSLVRISNGVLHLRATRWRRPDGQPIDSILPAAPDQTPRKVLYRSGMINLKPNRVIEGYGAYEARLRLPMHNGAWPAFWLWSCPTEIDMLDGVVFEGENQGALCNVIDNRLPTAKRPGNQCSPLPEADPAPSVASEHGQRINHIPKPRRGYGNIYKLVREFNTFTLVWTPNEAQFFINGRPVFSVPRSEVGTVKDFVNVLVTMQMNPWGGDEDAVLDVDYVRILKPRAPTPDGPRPYASTLAVDPVCLSTPPSFFSRLLDLFL